MVPVPRRHAAGLALVAALPRLLYTRRLMPEQPMPHNMPTAPLTVAVTGATGFVGRHTVRELASRGHTVRALVRDREKARTALAGVEHVPIQGDIFDSSARQTLLDGCDAVVHLVGIRKESAGGVTFQRMHVDATRAMLGSAIEAGVSRWVQMSALGVRADAPTKYQQTKWEGEQLVRSSDLDWTILRPSLIHGPDGEFLQLAKGWVRGKAPPYKFLPYFCCEKNRDTGGTGPGVAQPVYVRDVASAIAQSLASPDAIGEIYPLGGPDAYEWPVLLETLRDSIPGANLKLKPWGLNATLVSHVALGAQMLGLGGLLPFGPSDPIMGAEDNTCEIAKAQSHLGFAPEPFEQALESYAKQI